MHISYQIKHTYANYFPSQVLIKQFYRWQICVLPRSLWLHWQFPDFFLRLINDHTWIGPMLFLHWHICWVSFAHKYFTTDCTRFFVFFVCFRSTRFLGRWVYKVSIIHRYGSGWPSRIDEILHCDLISCQSTAHNAAWRIIFSTSQAQFLTKAYTIYDHLTIDLK